MFTSAKSGTASRSRSGFSLLARIIVLAGTILSPAILSAYSSNPPLRLTGAPGEGTCQTCHSPQVTGSGVSVAFPGGLTYTPGVAMAFTVTAPGGNGGFELSTRLSSNSGQAGSLGSGTNSSTSTSSGIQYAFHTARAASWTIPWTPPATSVGNVIVYVVGVNPSGTFTNTYTLTPATPPPPPPSNTLTATPTTLTFNYSGVPLATQTVQVSSSGASIAFTASVTTASGGNWLSATPNAGNTPMAVTVTAIPSGLAAGQYTGTITIAAAGASNSPRTVSVTLQVAAPPPPARPQLTSSMSALSFDGSTGNSQTLQVKASDGSAQSFSAAASTSSGGNWLSVTPLAGATPATATVAVNTAGLADGTYTGTVKFTSPGVTNSPLSVGVTLKVGTTLPPTQPDPLRFTFNVIDKQSGGDQKLLLDGSGAIDDAGKLSGYGRFSLYTTSGDEDEEKHTVATGKWKATGFVSFTSSSSNGEDDGGILEIAVNWTPQGGKTVPATLRIADTGSDSGVTVTIGAVRYSPTGTGHVSIRVKGKSGDDDDSERDR